MASAFELNSNETPVFRIYARALAILGRSNRSAWTLGLLNIALSGAMLIEPWLFGRVVDAMASKRSGEAWQNIATWAVVGMLGVVAGVLLALHADRLSHRRRQAVTIQFVEHVLSLPLSFHNKNHTSRLLSILHRGTNQLSSLWLGFFRSHLSTMISILVMVPAAFYLNWKLALVMTVMMCLFLGFSIYIIKRTNAGQYHVEQLNSKIFERIGDIFANVMVVQSFLQVRTEVQELRIMLEKVFQLQHPVLRGWAFVSMAQRAASTLTVVLIFALGVHLQARAEISIGEIVSFVGFVMLMLGRMEQLARFISELPGQSHAIRDLFSVLDAEITPVDKPGAFDLINVKGEIEFENVSFRYEGPHANRNRMALDGVSFKARAGQTIALVGATGAGKTTTSALLYRAYEPTSGRILIDGVDIRDVSLSSLRRNLAVVFQDSGLLFRSIADNLRIGNPDATDNDVHAVASAAQAHFFVTAKTEAYATIVTERGRSLSGGERQRLAVARAMLKNAPILVLDEATSALDNATEVQVQRAIQALTQKCTTLIIAHRLSTIRHADVILVLDKGKLVEQGTYNELIDRDGAFAALVNNGELAGS